MSDDIFLFVADNFLHILSNNSHRTEIFEQVYVDRRHRLPFENYEDSNEENFHNGFL